MIQTLERTRPDFEAIKQRQQSTWASGRFARIGSLIQVTGELLAEAMDVRPGARFLDVAAGNGNLSLAAARRFARVISTDYVTSALKDGAARAAANGFDIRYEVADAEALPFPDDSFDQVGSTFGAMFAPDQLQAAAEMYRVCKPGGTIGMANWTPDGFVGALLRLVGKYNPPPVGVESPARWGTKAFVDRVFGAVASSMRMVERCYSFRFLSAEHFIEVFAEHYGPIRTAMEGMGDDLAYVFEQELVDLLNAWNLATDGTLCVPGEYLECVIVTRA